MKRRKLTFPFEFRISNLFRISNVEFRIFVLGFFIIHSSFCVSSASTVGGRPPPKVPAFPGAEGAGAITPGGRGGKVYEVTTLTDGGPGSLREAFAASEPRIVVFRVSGIITLTNRLPINQPFITVAGQTAPGDGICIRGETTEINTHDVIIRYLRFRRGELKRRDDALGGNPVCPV